ncbi:MAG: hypothetical protein GX087_05010 [Desulfobulbaceae bacterium]|nr:hypothetical protein [Desulfobulbaceae bacterium]
MNKLLGILCAGACTFGFAAMASSTEVNPQTCQQVIENSCTKCHGIKRICTTLDKADADWSAIVADMGRRGKLSQEVQDQALSCLTSADVTVKGTICPQK